MRNMPPTTANYIQRQGGLVVEQIRSLCVTFAQRRSHDLNYFAKPETYGLGEGQTTDCRFVKRKNCKAASTLGCFSAFFRWAFENYGGRGFRKDVGDFLLNADGEKGFELLTKFLDQKPQELREFPYSGYSRWISRHTWCKELDLDGAGDNRSNQLQAEGS